MMLEIKHHNLSTEKLKISHQRRVFVDSNKMGNDYPGLTAAVKSPDGHIHTFTTGKGKAKSKRVSMSKCFCFVEIEKILLRSVKISSFDLDLDIKCIHCKMSQGNTGNTY